MVKRRVLLTGAAGYISSRLLPALRERYELVLLDITKESRRGRVDDIVDVDLTDPNVDAYRAHFEGVDAIVHNAFRWDPGRDNVASTPRWLPQDPDHPPGRPDAYYVERGNIDMVFHVMRLALEEDVRRVVVTSSNHAADWYETKLHSGRLDMVGPDTYPLSDNLYGWAKACYEHLGFVFATGRFGRSVENVHIRVGAPRRVVGEKLKHDQVGYRRELGAFISERDLQQLYIKSIEAEDVRNEDGIPFQIFYGVSNNTRAFWSIVNARRVIGYAPEDDSELVFADDIRRFLKTPGWTS